MAVSTSGKQCVTCQHFNGAREPDAFKKGVRYEAACKGMCLLSKQNKAANKEGGKMGEMGYIEIGGNLYGDRA